MSKELIKKMWDEACESYDEAKQIEEDNDYSDAMESMDRAYWEGQTDAIYKIYKALFNEDME